MKRSGVKGSFSSGTIASEKKDLKWDCGKKGGVEAGEK
jgi:hypothetical protein